MSLSATLYRFRIELSDVDRGVYDSLDFRIAQHPSESAHYLLTRVLAYALNFQDGLKFSALGLGDPDGPAILVENAAHGSIELWIEIGNPSTKKLHRASKAAERVKIYTYKDPQLIIREAESEKIHNAENVEIYFFKQPVLERLANELPREVGWQLLHHDGLLTIGSATQSVETEVGRLALKNLTRLEL